MNELALFAGAGGGILAGKLLGWRTICAVEFSAFCARRLNHGTPITPTTAAARAIFSGHAFVSFHRPDQLGIVLEVAQSFAVDNGAFSAWRSGKPITDWQPYYIS